MLPVYQNSLKCFKIKLDTSGDSVCFDFEFWLKIWKAQDVGQPNILVTLPMDFLIDGLISSFCPDQSEADS